MPSTAGAASNAAAGGDDPASEPQQQQPGVSTAAATNGGLVSPNGSSILWDADSMWILMFDNLLREGTRSPTKRSCGCKVTTKKRGRFRDLAYVSTAKDFPIRETCAGKLFRVRNTLVVSVDSRAAQRRFNHSLWKALRSAVGGI